MKCQFLNSTKNKNFIRDIKNILILIIFLPLNFIKLIGASLLYFLIVLMRPIFFIRIGELESRAIGHFTLPVEIYLCEIDLSPPKNSNFVDLFYFNKNICNKFIASKWRGYFHICPRFFLETLYHFLLSYNSNSKHLVPYRHWKITKRWQNFDINKVLGRSKIHLRFSDHEVISSENVLKKMGLTGREMVGFHARDPSYREGKNAIPGFRDSSIQNYLNAMNTVVEKGYAAVRIGRVVNEPLYCDNKNIVDYAGSEYATDLMDAYLLSKVKLLICSGSGIESLALCFRKPLVCVNLAEWVTLHLYNPNQYLLFIPKKFYWISNKKALSMREIIGINANRITREEELHSAGIYVEENSPNEINDVMLEALEIINGNHRYSQDDLDLQKAFKKCAGKYEGQELSIPIGMKFLKSNLYLLN